MANIVVSADTFLDTATGIRAGGDTVTFTNNSTFTVRTDTRFHANSPSGMTGTLSSITLGRGSTFIVDGTKVRWAQYTSGSGIAPVSNTTFTNGNITAVIIGFWPDLTSAPTTPGNAITSTGYIKFREITGGQFLNGTNISLNNDTTIFTLNEDKVGWIEFVMDSIAVLTNSPNGGGINFNGEWFDLGTTTGIAGQIIQIPTNGGTTTGTAYHGIQIETAPNSGIFEWYGGLYTTDVFLTTNIGTDIRAKYLHNMQNGQLRIGTDGTNLIGYIPEVGCKIRCPNIIVRSVLAASRATNTSPGRIQINTNTGKLNVSKTFLDVTFNSAIASEINIVDSVLEAVLNFTKPTSFQFLRNHVQYISTSTSYGTLNDIEFPVIKNNNFILTKGSGSNGMLLQRVNYLDMDSNNFKFLNTTYSSIASKITITSSNYISVKNTSLICGTLNITSAIDPQIINTDFCQMSVGTTNTTYLINPIRLISTTNPLIKGFTFGLKGLIANIHSYSTIIDLLGDNINVKIRNIGTINNPINSGTVNLTRSLISNGSSLYYNTKVTIQQVYFTGFATIAFTLAELGAAVLEYVNLGTSSIDFDSNSVNRLYKGINSSASFASLNSACKGTHWFDVFALGTNSTTGKIVWFGSYPSLDTASLNYIEKTSTYSGYIGNGISLGAIGDILYSEMPYFMKGHLSFTNTAPTIVGSSTSVYEIFYQINTGNGWNGTWKALNGANLSAEIVNPAGTKLKYKIEVISTTSNNTSYITSISIGTTTNLSTRAANQYPLDTVSLSFTNLQPGSEVRVYVGTDPSTSAEIGGIESNSGTTFTFTHDNAGQDGYIMIFAMGYQPIYLPYTFQSTDQTILIQQTVDRNYTNPI